MLKSKKKKKKKQLYEATEIQNIMKKNRAHPPEVYLQDKMFVVKSKNNDNKSSKNQNK